jgi:hypothetical protein
VVALDRVNMPVGAKPKRVGHPVRERVALHGNTRMSEPTEVTKGSAFHRSSSPSPAKPTI